MDDKSYLKEKQYLIGGGYETRSTLDHERYKELLTQKECSCRVGNIVREKRLARGLSQEKLAEICNVSGVTVSQLERGKTNCYSYTIIKIMRELKIDVTDLV